MSFMITRTGAKFSMKPEDLTRNLYHSEDIATALAKICRFNGHCDGFYSVAEHSVLVSHLVPFRLALPALLHDASEAYLGDMVTPLKDRCPDYRRFEQVVQDEIHQRHRIELTDVDEACIKKADRLALAIEFECLFPYPPAEVVTLAKQGYPGGIPEGLKPRRLDWYDARLAFIERYNELTPFMPEAA